MSLAAVTSKLSKSIDGQTQVLSRFSEDMIAAQELGLEIMSDTLLSIRDDIQQLVGIDSERFEMEKEDRLVSGLEKAKEGGESPGDSDSGADPAIAKGGILGTLGRILMGGLGIVGLAGLATALVTATTALVPIAFGAVLTAVGLYITKRVDNGTFDWENQFDRMVLAAGAGAGIGAGVGFLLGGPVGAAVGGLLGALGSAIVGALIPDEWVTSLEIEIKLFIDKLSRWWDGIKNMFTDATNALKDAYMKTREFFGLSTGDEYQLESEIDDLVSRKRTLSNQKKRVLSRTASRAQNNLIAANKEETDFLKRVDAGELEGTLTNEQIEFKKDELKKATAQAAEDYIKARDALQKREQELAAVELDIEKKQAALRELRFNQGDQKAFDEVYGPNAYEQMYDSINGSGSLANKRKEDQKIEPEYLEQSRAKVDAAGANRIIPGVVAGPDGSISLTTPSYAQQMGLLPPNVALTPTVAQAEQSRQELVNAAASDSGASLMAVDASTQTISQQNQAVSTRTSNAVETVVKQQSQAVSRGNSRKKSRTGKD